MPRETPGPRGDLARRHRAAARVRAQDPLAVRIAGDLRRLDGGLAARVEGDLAAGDRPLTVVWCEDDPSIQDLMAKVWELCVGARCWGANPEDRLVFTPDGDEALSLVRMHDADLFVTDEMHPRGPGGRQLLAALALEPGLALGYVTGCALQPCHAEGLDFCFGKAFDLQELLDVLVPLAERLRRGTYAPPPERAARIAAADEVR